MKLCKLVDRAEYLLLALVLLPTFLVIGAAIVSLADVARVMESELRDPGTPRTDERLFAMGYKGGKCGYCWYRPAAACLEPIDCEVVEDPNFRPTD